MNQLSDTELLIRSRSDAEAFGEIYDRHARKVHAYLARRTTHDAADDLLADVFVAAVSARHRVLPHESGSALPWLYGIAHNVLRGHLRRRVPLPGADRPADVDWEGIDARLDAVALAAELRAVLAGLTDVERELLLLTAWEQLTVTEAAQVLGITANAARSRLHRARSRAEALLASPTFAQEN